MGDAKNDPVKKRSDPEKTEANTLFGHEEKSGRKTNILKWCLDDAVHRQKVLHSLWISLIYMSLGMILGQNGPTLLDLQIITDTDFVTASYFLTGYSLGYLVGCILCGAIFDRVNKNLYMLTGLLTVGASTIITPYCFHYVAMVFIRVLVGIFFGCIHSGGLAEQMRVWGNQGAELIHMLQFCHAIGGVLSPLYTAPFLAKRSEGNSTSHSLANYTDLSTVFPATQPTTTDVRYAFVITGIICFISGIPWLTIFLRDKFGHRKDAISLQRVATQRKIPLHVFLYMLFMLYLIYILFMSIQVGFVSFLTAFLVEEYNETKSKGAQFTSVFWAMFATSRFMMLFISHMFTAVQLLNISCILTVVASICFTISAMFSAVDVLVVFTAVLGLSISGVLPAGFGWSHAYLIKITSRVSSSIVVSTSVGGMITPLLMGYLMENVSSMWFCYLLVIDSILMFFLFVTLFITSKFFINKRYAFEYETSIMEDRTVGSS